MKKIAFQSLVAVAAFGVVFFLFLRVNWLSVFGLSANAIEEKVGELYWNIYKNEADFITKPAVTDPLDSLLTVLCEANELNRSSVTVHAVRDGEVNAYALPGGHIVVNSAMLRDSKNEAEFCGVLAHELAHVQKGHVMKKTISELGISVLFSLLSGNVAVDVVREVADYLSSTAYSRQLEQEADDTAVDYLHQARISPLPMAGFFERMARKNEIPELMEWVNTHPHLEKRAARIRRQTRISVAKSRCVLSSGGWECMQQALSGE